MRISKYYLNIIKEKNDPIWRQCVPDKKELEVDIACKDPLKEKEYSPVSSVIHRYKDRALLLVTSSCVTYCRFCTRKRNISDKSWQITDDQLTQALGYIRENTNIRDVLISGGDPLTLPMDRLEQILKGIYSIGHVNMIRIGSRIPCVDPDRITPDLTNMLKKYHPLYMNVHFNHPNEITEKTKECCNLLCEAGIPLGNQSVLLKGINDSTDVMEELVAKLIQLRVRPYYLYIPDLVKGTEHFRTSIKTGLSIINQLRTRISNIAIPRLMIDLPNGGGKTPISSNHIISQDGNRYHIKNCDGEEFIFYDV